VFVATFSSFSFFIVDVCYAELVGTFVYVFASDAHDENLTVYYFQTKDTTDSRPRGISNTSSRGSGGGARVSADRYVGRGGATQFSSSGGKRMLVAIFLITLLVFCYFVRDKVFFDICC